MPAGTPDQQKAIAYAEAWLAYVLREIEMPEYQRRGAAAHAAFAAAVGLDGMDAANQEAV